MEQTELKIIKTAILNEIEGEKFYRNAALNAKNKDTSSAFLHLADEEKGHHEMLRKIMDRLIADDLSSDSLLMNQTNSPHIFTKAQAGSDDAMEISVFHIGILMEKASIDYYRNAAQTTKLPAARSLYEFLANWEVQHLESMEKIYDLLTEDWWDKQSYSPS